MFILQSCILNVIINIKMIFTCTELLETRRQIVNIIFKFIIIKVSVSW